MIYMKTWYSVLILAVAAIGIQAQVIDQEAKTLLENLKKKYTAYNSIQVQFKMINIDKTSPDFVEEREGTLYLKSKMFKLDLNDFEITCNGKVIWFYNKDVNQVQIQQYDAKVMEEEFGFAPNEIFNIDQEDFDYRISGNATVDEKDCKEVELSPKDKEKFYYKIKMYIDKASKQLMRAHFFEKDGIEYKFDILAQTPNKDMSDDFFTFDTTKHENIEVEDFRE